MGDKGPSSSSVFHVAGEPAICINGLPEISQDRKSPCYTNDVEDELQRPYFGRWFQGREVSKLFGNRFYHGKVVDFDTEMKWYRVVYEDGDFEDLDQDELEEVLLPVDVSVPLEDLFVGVGQMAGWAPSTEAGFERKNHSPVALRGRGRPKSGGSSWKNWRASRRSLKSE